MYPATFHRVVLVQALTLTLALPSAARAQGTPADYARAEKLRTTYEGLAGDIAGPATAIGKTHRFWYRKVYGGSAGGGQNALGGLFHPEFYKSGSAYAGCHDNRMDKIWWNEQWMGWPIGPQYSASSNVDNAYRLEGSLLLVVGELDTNVDPSSTMQVVNQLIKHNKDFDLLVVQCANHPAGRSNDPTAPYGDHKRFDFFVRHLLGVTPPPWNRIGTASTDHVPQP